MGLTPFADEPLTSGGMLGDVCRLLCLSAYTRAIKLSSFSCPLWLKSKLDFVLHTDFNRIEISHCLCRYQKLRLKPTPLMNGK